MHGTCHRMIEGIGPSAQARPAARCRGIFAACAAGPGLLDQDGRHLGAKIAGYIGECQLAWACRDSTLQSPQSWMMTRHSFSPAVPLPTAKSFPAGRTAFVAANI